MDHWQELRALVATFPVGHSTTLVPRLEITQGEIPAHSLRAVYPPMVNLIVNGGKDISVDRRTLHYDPATYFVLSLDLPATGRVHPASDGTPYQAVALLLDTEVLSEVVTSGAPAEVGEGLGYGVCPVTPELIDAWVRFLRLTSTPTDIPTLGGLYEREILYRVLQGPQGGLLRALARPDSALVQVRRAVEWIRLHYRTSFHIDRLAHEAAMSPSAFHRHFRRATGLSPVQYQKRFRLLAARRLLVSGRSATEAALDVGYESPSQFSREYSRFFGHSPLEEIRAVRHHARIGQMSGRIG